MCHTHYGHQTRLGHIRLGAQDRLQIAGKLAQGVTLDKILDDVRSSVSDNFKRVHLLQRKDIHNIERVFKLDGGQRHHDDATSVAAWVEEMRGKGEGNVALSYKPQGASDNKTGLQTDDFIVLQTPVQAEMLKKFGGKVVCVDATHGTNAYEFKLITLLVVDEYGEGFPVAWCIANREDRVLLIGFFTSIRTQSVGWCILCGSCQTWPISTTWHGSVCLTTHPKSLSAPGMLTGHGGGLAATCQGVERQLLRVLSEGLALDKSITLIGKVHIIIFNELIAVKRIHIYTYLDWYKQSFHN